MQLKSLFAFFTGADSPAFISSIVELLEGAKKSYPEQSSKSAGVAGAPFLVHPSVDGLHSVAAQADTLPSFSLTLKIEGVKTYSFFDSF